MTVDVTNTELSCGFHGVGDCQVLLLQEIICRIHCASGPRAEEGKTRNGDKRHQQERDDHDGKHARHEPASNRLHLDGLVQKLVVGVSTPTLAALAHGVEECLIGARKVGHVIGCVGVVRTGHLWQLQVVSSVLSLDTSDN